MSLTVHSPFTPKGDQPEAIAGIVEGLGDGLRYQTLLGATGTGKSVHRDEPVTILIGENEVYRGPIGDLIDELVGHTQSHEHVEVPPPERWQVIAWNPERGEIGWRDIAAVSRHKSPEKMYRLTTACGRQVRVTGDHSVWVLRGGQLRLLPTSDVVAGDALPVPECLPAPVRPLRTLDLLEILEDGTTLKVDASAVLRHGTIGDVRETLEDHYSTSQARSKLYAMRRGIRGRGVKTSAAIDLRERFPTSSDELHFLGKRYRVPVTVETTPDLAGVWGHFLAEGHAADRYAVVSVREPDVQDHLLRALDASDIPFFRRSDGDFVVATKLWRDLFLKLMGGSAHEKHLPAFWPALDNEALAALLRAYFEGDGGIDGAAVTAVTASAILATDLAEALLRFGIWARTREVAKRRPDGTTGSYHKITISGADNLARFSRSIGFISERKRARLHALAKPANTNVDLVYGVGERLKCERERRGLLQREVAERAGVSRAAVSVIETGRRNPSRAVFERLCRALDISDPAFVGLAELHWSPLTEIETEPAAGDELVYDLSVPGFETFLTGRGGLFVHNTFAVARIIEETQRPALVLAPNKILTAQLASEFREFFPEAAVEFFISYYDYYQPEAYVPARDLFIEKDANINAELERLRHSTTRSLLTRRDTIVVASVSAIYGLGSPDEYRKLNLLLKVGERIGRDEILERLVSQQYERNDIELAPGRFRAKGDVIEIWAAYEEAPLRIELWGDEIDRLAMVDPITGNTVSEPDTATVFPARHYVTPIDKLEPAIAEIERDLAAQLELFERSGKLLEKQRLKERTLYDLEMLRTLGYCSGIENYSRYLDGRQPGEPPHTLLDYFPDDFLVFIDESHVMVPQIRGMYNGDQARKRTLVDHGFRLPGALDNRPLTQDEFFERVAQVVFVSATPAAEELERSDRVVEQVIRPTGLIDPAITIKPSRGQIDDLVFAVRERAARDERVLVTTLTKKMSEDLTEYFAQQGLRVRYMHSDIDALERQVIIRDLRLGHFDVLVGINLLREGLDLPEVSLVAILDADKTGFLRSERSLIQTIGRAARNVNGEVFLYADEVSAAMKGAIDETARRREKQLAYNEEHGITPETVTKTVRDVIRGSDDEEERSGETLTPWEREIVLDDVKQELAELESEMWIASEELDFERAAAIRDRIREVEAKLQGKDVKIPTLPGQKGKASSLKA